VNTELLEKIYQSAMSEYLEKFAKSQNLNSERVVVGTGYTDMATSFPKETNTFVPLAPVAYSDNMGSNVIVVKKQADNYYKETSQPEVSIPEQTRIKTHGVSYLTYEDSLATAYLEEKAFQGTSLAEGLTNVMNGLIAAEISNVVKERPNLSIKYGEQDGRVQSYIIAYETRVAKRDIPGNVNLKTQVAGSEGKGANGEGQDAESEDKNVKSEGKYANDSIALIYVADLAADPNKKFAGPKVLTEFLNLYNENYFSKGNNLPIFAEAREATSYKLLFDENGKMREGLQRFANKIGAKIKVTELDTSRRGGEAMHKVLIEFEPK
jgi:hypothetical protein